MMMIFYVLVSAAERPWAVVTGASGGLGASLARDVSKRGYNVVLAARRADRLADLAAELRAEGEDNEAICCCCDLAYCYRLFLRQAAEEVSAVRS